MERKTGFRVSFWKKHASYFIYLLILFVEVYRLLWVLVLEKWTVYEEKYQFGSTSVSRHNLTKEFGIFQKIKLLFLEKFLLIEKLEQKKKQAISFEQNLFKATLGTDLLARIQKQIKEAEDFNPSKNKKLSKDPSHKEPNKQLLKQ